MTCIAYPNSDTFETMNNSERESLRAQLRDLYGLYRTALLSVKYYSFALTCWRIANKTIEILLALGTTGTAWAIWKTEAGGYVWMIVAAASAVLCLLKPIVRPSEKIEKFSSLRTSFSDLYYDIEAVVEDAKKRRNYTSEMDAKVRNARERMKQLATKEVPSPFKKLVCRFQREVNKQIVPKSLWWPN